MAPAPEWSAVEAPWWDDRPVAIVGSGRSLVGFDFGSLNSPLWRTVAVKEAHNDVPWADVIVSVDLPWLTRRREVLLNLSEKLVLGMPEEGFLASHGIPGAKHVRRSRLMEGLSDDPERVEFGATSGFFALNYTYLKRARQIGLFGFDYVTGHYNEALYPWRTDHNAHYWPRWAKMFELARPQLDRAGVEVFCASPQSNVVAFDRCTPQEGVGRLRRWATEMRS